MGAGGAKWWELEDWLVGVGEWRARARGSSSIMLKGGSWRGAKCKWWEIDGALAGCRQLEKAERWELGGREGGREVEAGESREREAGCEWDVGVGGPRGWRLELGGSCGS